MKRVTGIGGVFFKCADPAVTRDWYKKHLGLGLEEWGGWIWEWKNDGHSDGCTVWNPFEAGTDHFQSEFMINYRVADLAALLEALKSEGVTVVKGLEESPQGKFAWIQDCDGRKVELWEPAPA